MSLDDLITLLLVVLFVGAPLVQRFMRGGTGSQQPGEGPEAGRSEGEAGGAEGGSAREAPEPSGRGARADRGESSSGQSELERRIEEARRRVRQAREGTQPSRSSTPSRTPQAAASPAQSSRQDRDVPRPLIAPRESRPSSSLGREGVTRQPAKKAPPMQVAKLKSKGRASKLVETRVLSLDAHNILQGIVWHQILSERKGKRAPRRQPSRDR